MTTHFDNLSDPINQMNDKLLEASQLARTQPGLVLAGQMLNQLRTTAIGSNFLVLRPTKGYFYKAMLKRENKILQAIQLIAPEVVRISIIEVE